MKKENRREGEALPIQKEDAGDLCEPWTCSILGSMRSAIKALAEKRNLSNSEISRELFRVGLAHADEIQEPLRKRWS